MCRINKYEVVCEKVESYNTDVIDRKIANSKDVAVLLTDVIGIHKSPVERFVVIMVNCKMQLIGYQEIGIGGTDTCPVDIKAVFRAAIVSGMCSGIVVAHNHPSGDPTPSNEDASLTKNLIKAGELLGVKVLDHLIIGDKAYTSMKAEGYFDACLNTL